jgi:hypothetical protein
MRGENIGETDEDEEEAVVKKNKGTRRENKDRRNSLKTAFTWHQSALKKLTIKTITIIQKNISNK